MLEDQVVKYNITVSAIFDTELDDGRRSFEFEKESIVNFSVAKDFRDSMYPVTYMALSMSDRDYYYIKENKNNVKFLVKLDSYLVDDNGTLEQFLSNKRPYMKNNIITMIFRPYFDDVTPFSNSKINENNILSDDESSFRVLDMYLFSDESLEKNKTDCNFILNNSSIFDAIIYSCNKVGVNKLIIETPDNEEEYKQIISPPLKFKQAINFLQENYGIYNRGVISFHDFKRSYILPKYLKSNVTETDECKVIYVLINEKNGENINMNLSSYYDTERNIYVINTLNTLGITDNSNLNKEIIGDDLNVIDINTLETDKINLELNSYKSENNITKSKNLINYNSNSFVVNELKSSLQNEQITVSMNLTNIDVDYLTPNKELVLIFEENSIQNKYGGHYSIKSLTYTISRESGGSQDFYIKVSLELNKVMY